MAGDETPGGPGPAPPPAKRRHLRKRALAEDVEEGGSGGEAADPTHAPATSLPPAATLGDLKFLQKQRGRRTGITADSLLAAPARAAAGAAADLLAGAHSGGAAGGALTASVEDGTAALGGTYVRGADAAALAAAEAEAEAQLFIEAELAARAGQGRGVEGGEAATPSEGFFAIPAALRGQAAEAGPRIDAYMTGVVEVDIGRGDRLAALEAAEAARRAALGLCGGGGGGASPPAPRGAFPKNFGGKGGRRR